jgi:hypothetical protein
MRKVVLLALLLFGESVIAGGIDNHYCDNWVKDKKGSPLVKLSELTDQDAKKGLAVLTRMVRDTTHPSNTPYYFESINYREAELKVHGYLLVKEIYDGEKYKQPDPEMKNTFCSYWADAAYR